MEVKIKQGKEMIDATIEVVDGVMVVSPKEVKKEKFIPKIGDVITCTNSALTYTLLVKNISCNRVYSFALVTEDGFLLINDFADYKNPRPATKEEKQKLFDKLAVKGWKLDSEKRKLVKLKWKPSVGQHFYYPEYDNGYCEFIIKAFTYAFEDQIERDKAIAKGWCFKTSKECQDFCDRLNEAINSVKP